METEVTCIRIVFLFSNGEASFFENFRCRYTVYYTKEIHVYSLICREHSFSCEYELHDSETVSVSTSWETHILLRVIVKSDC